ncbi:VCBS domain-containing protein, partial [Alphaproteobacteria bacterium]|nr:VCBS domain-containing protein [Alphaproteobacteria bacterium]
TGEHTGDVMDTSSSSHSDSDADASASLSITGIRTGQESGSGTSGSVGSSLTGTYGALTINANGSYSYAANSSISGLGSGDEVIDYFTYTVSDGSATDTAQLKITVIGVGNTAPVARNDVGVIAEDSTLSVSDGANANETGGSYNATGEHSGDVINTSSTTHYDTDADGDTLTVTAIRLGSSEGSGTAGTVGQALTGTYGQLTLNANGSYSYVANQTAADALDAGDSVSDTFNYTISDGTATDIGTITITVLGINDAPVAQNDVGVIVEGSTLTVANSANANVSGSYDATGEHSGDVIDTSSSSHTDSDADASSSLSITHIKLSGGSNSTVASSSSYNSNGTSITGTYGTITIGADGSYTYAATTDATDALDAGESATDTFVYTLSDGTAITTANITITVLGANDAPVAQNDTGTINEDATLTVSDGDGASTVAGASFLDSFDLSSQEALPQGVAFNPDGTKMFIVGKDGDDVNEYTLSTGYDVSTASYDSNFSVSSQDAVPQDIVFNTDGTKMFIVGEENDAVYEYTLSTGFDVSTASYDSNFSIASQETSPQGLAFNNDGTKMFVVGGTGDDVNEYTLSTGFDVSTASFVDSFDISSQDTAPNGLVFNSDGTKMFVTGNTGNDINEYILSTGFDVSTASFVGNISVSSQDTTPGGIKFNHDGTKLFMVGVAGADINEYTLTSPFSLVNVSGEHTGDVIDSSNTSTRDTDV